MLERAHAAGLPFAWVTADSVYGADHALRRWLQQHGLGYVLAVTKAQRLGFSRVEDRVAGIPAGLWRRLSAGDGAKGHGSTTGAICPMAAMRHPVGRRAYCSGAASPSPMSSPSTSPMPPTARHSPNSSRWPARAGRSRPASRPPRARSAWISTRSAPRDGLLAIAPSGLDRRAFWPAMGRLAPPRHPGHAGARLPRRTPQGRRRGTSPRSTWQQTCSRLPCRRSAACSGISSRGPCPTWRLRSPGHAGAAATSNVPAAVTGNGEPPLKPGCSTRAFSI